MKEKWQKKKKCKDGKKERMDNNYLLSQLWRSVKIMFNCQHELIGCSVNKMEWHYYFLEVTCTVDK